MELSRPNVKSSKQYEIEGSFDIWEQLGLEAEVVSKDEITQEVTISAGEHTYTVRPKPLNLRERMAVLLGKQPECVVTDEWTQVVDAEGSNLPLEEEERKATRRWILAADHTNAPAPVKLPTPQEQGEEAMKLVKELEREHNPALVEAIKALPKPEEVLLKFPRQLTAEEKRKIKQIANSIVRGKPVSVKVSL